MRRILRYIGRGYFAATLGHPKATLAALLLLVAALGAFAPRLELDASADSLVLENDQALEYYRSIRARYGSDDYLIVTYRPGDPLFERPTLERLAALQQSLSKQPNVDSVTSLLDVPLLHGRSFSDLGEDMDTLGDRAVDPAAVRGHFLDNPLYRNVLAGADGEVAGLYILLKQDRTYQELLQQRDRLRQLRLERALTAAERAELEELARRFRAHAATANLQLRKDVAGIRTVLERYRDQAEIHLAGVPMIAVDMIRFIAHDLRVFGAGVLAFVTLLLAVSFRRPRWVLIPLLLCMAPALAMLGVLGLMGKPLTVVSANFLPVLLIVTLSLVVHLIVRQEELHGQQPRADPAALLERTLRDKFAPCLYTALTTMVAFASLTVSGIRPVIDLGWLMVAGIALAFVVVFLAYPAMLVLLPAADPVRREKHFTRRVTGLLLGRVENRRGATLAVAVVLMAVGVAGAARVSVENNFIDYFDTDTEIHRGMLTLDRELGGTTPLEVILDPDPGYRPRETPARTAEAERPGLAGGGYWFNRISFDEMKGVHDYLDGLPETGKVLSAATSLGLLEALHGAPLDSFTLAIIDRRLPEDIRQRLFDPYVSADGNQLRYQVRLYESNPGADRGALLDRIRSDLADRFGLAPGQVQLTGMAVLYNNMLESLFRAQATTFGFVLAAVAVMFLALFRSIKVALVALLPNLLVAALVPGLMGWAGISLDMMTITIVAIAMGISVDDTIHYTHRFRRELEEDGDYRAAARRSHASIGRAVFYTSVIITLGFSILTLSDFVPTRVFGLLTGAAMMAALLADLMLLPVLFAVFRPFGPSSPGRAS